MRKMLLTVLLIFLLSMPSAFGKSTVHGISQEIQCLAKNVYFESRGENFKGKLAVALVTLNRTKKEGYPKSICGVVYQKGQFSWTTKRQKITDVTDYTDSLLAATMAMENSNLLGDFKATHYHNLTVAPAWGLHRVARIGKHIFYS